MNQIVLPNNAAGTLTVTVTEQWNDQPEYNTVDAGTKYKILAVPAYGYTFVRFEWIGRIYDDSESVTFENSSKGGFDPQSGEWFYEAEDYGSHRFKDGDLFDRHTVSTFSWGRLEAHHVIDSITAVFRKNYTYLILRTGTPGTIVRNPDGLILRDA